MPILCNVQIPGDDSEPIKNQKELTTQRSYRFSGYKFIYDDNGNIIHARRPSWQPRYWVKGRHGANSFGIVKFV